MMIAFTAHQYIVIAVKQKGENMFIALWAVQGLLTVGFLLTGLMKTFAPIGSMKKNMPWTGQVPVALVRFIGVAEFLGAIGLILPEALRIQPWLTMAAAIGLGILMLSAFVFHISRKEYSALGASIALLLLATFVAVGHLVWIPLA